ncbi:hypothetical protein BC833DRAFT_589460, partial [Globomyces pollinis-pini]
MIYVLLLQENKFYVGYSERPIGERFIEHFNYLTLVPPCAGASGAGLKKKM